MTSRPSTAAPILAVLAIGLALLGAYVGGYLWLGTRHEWPPDGVVRVYRFSWQAKAFIPLASIESALRDGPVFCVDEASLLTVE